MSRETAGAFDPLGIGGCLWNPHPFHIPSVFCSACQPAGKASACVSDGTGLSSQRSARTEAVSGVLAATQTCNLMWRQKSRNWRLPKKTSLGHASVRRHACAPAARESFAIAQPPTTNRRLTWLATEIRTPLENGAPDKLATFALLPCFLFASMSRVVLDGAKVTVWTLGWVVGSRPLHVSLAVTMWEWKRAKRTDRVACNAGQRGRTAAAMTSGMRCVRRWHSPHVSDAVATPGEREKVLLFPLGRKEDSAGDVRPHRFLVQLNPRVRDQHSLLPATSLPTHHSFQKKKTSQC